MIEQSHRLSSGGQIDRGESLDFVYNDTNYKGHPGDTLASALLANGENVLARSFKYHRPRGVFSAGPEEPSALMTVGYGARREPNTQATVQPLYQGLVSSSQNCWPSPRFDLGEVNSLLGPFFSAGFYYKTFMWPGLKGWMQYEKIIRKAAGMGAASREPDPDRYEKSHGFCDVLVVGAGPAGLMAATAAAATGARVWLVDEQLRMGGQLNRETLTIEGLPATQWAAETVRALEQNPQVKLLGNATVFGAYDGQTFGIVERCGAGSFKPEARQRMWVLRTAQVVLATGSIERPLVFGNNDRPGVMQANAVRAYNNQYGVRCGDNTLVFANNNSAYRTAIDLANSGQNVAAVVDSRGQVDAALLAQLADLGIKHIGGSAVQDVHGKLAIKAAQLVSVGGNQLGEAIDCDCVAVSGGWSPNVQLHSMVGGRPQFSEELSAFVPGDMPAEYRSAGACTGSFALQDCLSQGATVGAAAAAAAGFSAAEQVVPSGGEDNLPATEALWRVPKGKGKQFVDLQHDVAATDIDLAHLEGYQSVEHLKRYTTLGMAGDQGRSSNVNALALMAQHRQEPIAAVGTTTFRPPLSPVAMGVFGGLERGQHFSPFRRSAMQAWHDARGAVLQEVGLWRRAQYYPIGGETLDEAYQRETAQVRAKVGMVDVSSLGKIQVNGPDSPEFLNRLYVNNWLKLPVGKARYGVMLREDGIALDDGTTSRWGEDDFLMTTTTANAGPVLTHMEHLLQVVWPELRVRVSSVTEHWAGMAVAGPLSRATLQGCVSDLDLSNEGFPFMAVGEGKIDGVPVRVLRISFSGEMAYEVYAPADYGQGVWEAIMRAGEIHDIVPYGTETLGALRIEKGHVTGAELDGRVTLGDVGMLGMANAKKDFIGRVMMNREGLLDPTRPLLTGLKSVDPDEPLQAGAILINSPEMVAGVDKLGHVSSVTYSPEVGGNIGLGFLRDAPDRRGDKVYAAYPLRDKVVEVEVCDPCFVDPTGGRMRD